MPECCSEEIANACEIASRKLIAWSGTGCNGFVDLYEKSARDLWPSMVFEMKVKQDRAQYISLKKVRAMRSSNDRRSVRSRQIAVFQIAPYAAQKEPYCHERQQKEEVAPREPERSRANKNDQNLRCQNGRDR